MKRRLFSLGMAVLILPFVFAFTGCDLEARDAINLVGGTWETASSTGTWVRFDADGTFESFVNGVNATGTWRLVGSLLFLNIAGSINDVSGSATVPAPLAVIHTDSFSIRGFLQGTFIRQR